MWTLQAKQIIDIQLTKQKMTVATVTDKDFTPVCSAGNLSPFTVSSVRSNNTLAQSLALTRPPIIHYSHYNTRENIRYVDGCHIQPECIFHGKKLQASLFKMYTEFYTEAIIYCISKPEQQTTALAANQEVIVA